MNNNNNKNSKYLRDAIIVLVVLVGATLAFCGVALRDVRLVGLGVGLMLVGLWFFVTGGPPKLDLWDKLRRLLQAVPFPTKFDLHLQAASARMTWPCVRVLRRARTDA